MKFIFSPLFIFLLGIVVFSCDTKRVAEEKAQDKKESKKFIPKEKVKESDLLAKNKIKYKISKNSSTASFSKTIYNEKGFVTKVEVYQSPTDKKPSYYIHTYNDEGKEVEYSSYENNKLVYQTKYFYKNGLLVKKINTNEKNYSDTVNYEYNEKGLLIGDNDIFISKYFYSDNDLLWTETKHMPGDSEEIIKTHYYDERGWNIKTYSKSKQFLQEWHQVYDSTGQIAKDSVIYHNIASTVKTYQYNEMGLLEKEITNTFRFYKDQVFKDEENVWTYTYFK